MKNNTFQRLLCFAAATYNLKWVKITHNYLFNSRVATQCKTTNTLQYLVLQGFMIDSGSYDIQRYFSLSCHLDKFNLFYEVKRSRGVKMV